MTDEQKFEANIQNDIPLILPPPPSGFVTTGAAVADVGTSIEKVAIMSSIALFLIYGSRRALAQKKTGQVQLGCAVLSMAIAAIVYIYDFANLTSLSEEESNEIIQFTVEPQIGIIIGTIGAVVGAISCFMLWNKRRNL